MEYEIKGGNLPVVEIKLNQGESIRCESGAMSWMSDNIKMDTNAGGIGKIFSRAFMGEKLFQNTYTATSGDGYIALASSFPGNIVAIPISDGKEIICQKTAFLASCGDIDISVFFQKKIGVGFAGGEGFIMQKISGNGMVFIEIDGSAVEKELASGEKIVIDTGYLAMMDSTCSVDVTSVKGIKNVFFGGESFFNTVVTGPGKVVLQTMPARKLADSLIPYLPKPDNNNNN